MANIDVASSDDLDRQLVSGTHEMMRDAAGQQIQRDRLPIGVVPPGQTLLQFWHLDFPIRGPDYNQPAVILLLIEMLSIRRLSPGAANALGLRISTALPAAYGRDGSVMAAMLLARCRQAIAEPEAFPSLLDDGELKAAYTVYKQVGNAFSTAGGALGTAAAAPKVAGTAIGKNSNLPEWLRRLGRGLRALEMKLMCEVPPNVRQIKIPDAGFNRGKPFTVSGPLILKSYIGWILGTGALQNSRRADAYAAEMTRRGLALQ